MRDQVEAVEARGLYAGAVYSALPEAEVKESLREATPGDSKLLYVTPESLHDDELVARLRLAQEAGRDGELARCSLIYRPGAP